MSHTITSPLNDPAATTAGRVGWPCTHMSPLGASNRTSGGALVLLEKLLNRRCGGSTGTNLYASFQIIAELKKSGRPASLVTMICDGGERYQDSYYDDEWLQQKGFDLAPYEKKLQDFLDSGNLEPAPAG